MSEHRLQTDSSTSVYPKLPHWHTGEIRNEGQDKLEGQERNGYLLHVSKKYLYRNLAIKISRASLGQMTYLLG